MGRCGCVALWRCLHAVTAMRQLTFTSDSERCCEPTVGWEALHGGLNARDMAACA